MTAKEAREIIAGMELSDKTLAKAEAMLEVYKDNEEIPEDLIDKILLMVDKEIDINKMVDDSDDEVNSVL